MLENEGSVDTHVADNVKKWRQTSQKRYQKRRGDIKFGTHCKSIADMDDLFVDLELLEIGDRIDEKSEKQLKSYKDLLHIQDKEGEPCMHILLRGNAGSGKTTLVSRLSYKWATSGSDNDYRYLEMFDLLITLDVRKFKVEQTLEQAIKSQLLPGVSEETIAEVLSELGPKCLFLIDGYDEMSEQSWENENQVLDSPLLDDSFVIITSRPDVVDKFCQKYQRKCVHVQVKGFSESQVHEYVKRFFKVQKKTSFAESLSHRIEDTSLLLSLATSPILLLMLCHLWLDKESDLPESYTEIYVEAIEYLNKHWEVKYKKEKGEVLEELGKIALDNLLKGKLTFDTKGLSEECITNACKIGLVYSEEMDRHRTCLTFIHKTFHEFCAAKFLVNLLEKDVPRFNTYLEKFSVLDLTLRFCCGLSTKTACVVLGYVLRSYYRNDRNGTCYPLTLFNEALKSKISHQEDEMCLAEFKRSLSETCESATELSMGLSYHGVFENVQTCTLLEFLSSMPSSLKSFNLGGTQIAGHIDTSIYSKSKFKPFIKVFKMCHCEISENTLNKLLACMPLLEDLTLENTNFTDQGNCEELVHTIKKFKLSCGQGFVAHARIVRYRSVYADINMGHLPNFFRLISTNLQTLKLEQIDTKELDSQSVKSINWHALTEFSLNAREMRASNLVELLLSMPLLKELVLDLLLEVEYTQYSSRYNFPYGRSHSPFQLQMTKGTQLTITEGKMTVLLLLKLLGCFPTLDVITLCSLDMKDTYLDIQELLKESLQSLKWCHLKWCNINPKTLVHMLSCMPALKEVSFHMVNALGTEEHDTYAPIHMQANSLTKFLRQMDDSSLLERQELGAELGIFWGCVSQNTLHDICQCRPLLEKVTLKDMHVIDTSECAQAAMSNVIVDECAMIHVLISRKALMALLDAMPLLKTLILDRSSIQWEVPHLEVIVECTVGSNVKLETNLLSQFKNCETFLEQMSLMPSVDHVVLMPLLRETSVRMVPFRNINNDTFAFANQALQHFGQKLLNKSFMFILFCFREHFLDKGKLSEYSCKDLILSSCNLDPETLQNILNCMPSLTKVDMRECAILLACNTDVLMGYNVRHPSLQRPLWLPVWYKPHELKLCDVVKLHDTIKGMERDIDKTVTGKQRVVAQEMFRLSTLVRENHTVCSDITLCSCRLQVTKEELMQILTDFQPEEPVIHRTIHLEDSTIIVNL